MLHTHEHMFWPSRMDCCCCYASVGGRCCLHSVCILPFANQVTSLGHCPVWNEPDAAVHYNGFPAKLNWLYYYTTVLYCYSWLLSEWCFCKGGLLLWNLIKPIRTITSDIWIPSPMHTISCKGQLWHPIIEASLATPVYSTMTKGAQT